MIGLRIYEHLLRCPECSTAELKLSPDKTELTCCNCLAIFPIVNGCPILLNSSNQLFSVNDYVGKLNFSFSEGSRLQFVQKIIPTLSVNLSSERVLTTLNRMLEERSSQCVVLVVGGGRQRSWLNKRIGTGENIQIIYSDIDVNADMDLVCDGHDLPFVDEAFDAVVTTAVLEHVLYPEKVADEIQRVLKLGGLLYSEMPFMQQVHEGAYDFTRYTLSGHRRLFNSVEELSSGLVAGPGTALAWAIENFVLSFVANSKTRLIFKVITRLIFSWVKYFDYLLKNRHEAMDGASCTYLFGQKTAVQIPDKKIIESYVGSKHISHT